MTELIAESSNFKKPGSENEGLSEEAQVFLRELGEELEQFVATGSLEREPKYQQT